MDFHDLLIWAPVLIGLGGVAGFLAGLLGVGGGLVLVPGLFFSLSALGYDSDHLMHLAVGTSLAIIIPTGLSSALSHAKRKSVRMDLVWRIGPGILAGVGLGTLIAAWISGDDLKLVFGTALLFLSGLMLIDSTRFHFAPDVPGQPWVTLAGGGIGTLSALMGIGGATVSVPYMTLCRVPIHQAVGTASALGMVISIPAATGYAIIGWGVGDLPPLSLGYINLLAFFLISPFSILAAPWGARTAHSISVHALRKVFAGFLVIISLRMLYDALYG
jgi:uncharacterized membrane protein YfcA